MADWSLLTEGFSADQTEASEQSQAARALLWAGAKAVERLGGKRRRGLGRCEFLLPYTQQEEQEFLQTLQGEPPGLPSSPDGEERGLETLQSNAAGAVSLPADTEPEVTPTPQTPAASAWVSVPLALDLLTPVVVPDRTVGNVVQSLDFVPGTYLLGPVTRALGQVLGRSLLPEVACGDLQVTNAYLEVSGVAKTK